MSLCFWLCWQRLVFLHQQGCIIHLAASSSFHSSRWRMELQDRPRWRDVASLDAHSNFPSCLGDRNPFSSSSPFHSPIWLWQRSDFHWQVGMTVIGSPSSMYRSSFYHFLWLCAAALSMFPRCYRVSFRTKIFRLLQAHQFLVWAACRYSSRE